MRYLRPFFESKNAITEEEIHDVFVDYLDRFNNPIIRVEFSKSSIYISISRIFDKNSFRSKLDHQIALNNCIKRFESLYEYNFVDAYFSDKTDSIVFNILSEEKNNKKGITVKDIESYIESNSIENSCEILILTSDLKIRILNSIIVHSSENRIGERIRGDRSISGGEIIDSIIDIDNATRGRDYFVDFVDESVNVNRYIENELYFYNKGRHKIVGISRLKEMSNKENIIKNNPDWEILDTDIFLICES